MRRTGHQLLFAGRDHHGVHQRHRRAGYVGADGLYPVVLLRKRGLYVHRRVYRRYFGGEIFLLAIVIGALFAGFIAFLLGSITLRLKGDYFLITCLGFGECVRVLFNYTKNITGGSAGFPGIPAYSNALFSVLCVVLAFFVAWRFIHSKYGRNLTSIRENEIGRASCRERV